MSGVRHHILPKFLQSGFTSRSVKDKTFAWFFRKGAEPIESNLDNISVERHFYGSPSELNVDPEITSLESTFATQISQIRQLPDNSDISTSGIIEFVVHLTSRTRHLRETLIDTTDDLLTELEAYYGIEANGRAFIRDHFLRHPELLSENVEEVIKTLPGTRSQRRFVANRLRRVPKSSLTNKIERDFPDFFMTKVHEQLETFKLALPKLVRQEHLKMLAKTLIPEPRAELYRRLTWRVRHSDLPLILGDVGCLFIVEGCEKWMPLAGGDEKINCVFLPISSNRLIVGKSDYNNDTDIDLINRNLAMRSREFFISSDRSEYQESLHSLLATESQLFSDEEMAKLVQDAQSET